VVASGASGGEAGTDGTGGSGGGTGGVFACAPTDPTPPREPGECCEANDECHTAVCSAGHHCVVSQLGGTCVDSTDCQGGNCDTTQTPPVCGKGVFNTPCGGPGDCLSDQCIGDLCEVGDLNRPCVADTDCALANCDPVALTCKRARAGGPCSDETDCLSGDCYQSGGTRVCFLGQGDAECGAGTDCMTGTCTTASSTCTAPTLVVTTQQTGSPSGDEFLDVQFSIENSGPPVPMADLTLFYFFTAEPTGGALTPQSPPPSSGTLAGLQVDQQVDPTDAFNNALRVSFSGATLDTSGTTGMLYLKVSHAQSGVNERQTNDFSWPTVTDLPSFGPGPAPNPRTVLCQFDGTAWHLVWGNPPPLVDPDPCGRL
jgi:hypothetical protein